MVQPSIWSVCVPTVSWYRVYIRTDRTFISKDEQSVDQPHPMYSIDLPETARFESYGVLSILANGRDGARDRLVAIGVGYVDGHGSPEVQIHTLADTQGDEGALVDEAFDWLARRECEALVTYDGAGFDLPFLRKKLTTLDRGAFPSMPIHHVDLSTERKREATSRGTWWPSLEDCLEAHGLPMPSVDWNGEALTADRLSGALVPRYLESRDTDGEWNEDLGMKIREHVGAQVEAIAALYEAEIG